MNEMGMTDTQFKGFISFLLGDIQDIQKKIDKETLEDEEIKEKLKAVIYKLDQIMKN